MDRAALKTLKSHLFLLENLENLDNWVDDDNEKFLVTENESILTFVG